MVPVPTQCFRIQLNYATFQMCSEMDSKQEPKGKKMYFCVPKSRQVPCAACYALEKTGHKIDSQEQKTLQKLLKDALVTPPAH